MEQKYSEFMTQPQIPGTGPTIQDFFSNRLFGDIRSGQAELGIYNTPQMQYPADNDNKSQNDGAFIPEEEKGIFSLGDILADLGRKGVEGFKDVAGRGIASKVYGGIGTMITGNPLIGGIASLAGLLTGGNMFDRSQSQMNFDNLSPEAQAYTSSLYNPGGLLSGYNQISARGVGALGTLQNRLGNIQGRKAPQTPYSINLSNQIQNAIDNIIADKDKKAGMNAPNNIGLGGGGGDSGGGGSSGYEGMSDAASDQERSEGGRGKR